LDTTSIYRGPVKTSELAIGGRTVRIVRPEEPDRLLDDPAVFDLNRRDDYMPYWAYLWPGAFLLGEEGGRLAWPPGLSALEIGCGLGLAGLSALMAGLETVHFTDYDEAPLRFVTTSARENGIALNRFTTALLDWRKLPDERYPVILGADVLYERRLVPLVSNLIAHMLAPEGIALVGGPYRVATEDLEPCLESLGLCFEVRPSTARDETGRPIRGTIHEIWLRDHPPMLRVARQPVA
jgi:predicted nicotinamide N-methyase